MNIDISDIRLVEHRIKLILGDPEHHLELVMQGGGEKPYRITLLNHTLPNGTVCPHLPSKAYRSTDLPTAIVNAIRTHFAKHHPEPPKLTIVK